MSTESTHDDAVSTHDLIVWLIEHLPVGVNVERVRLDDRYKAVVTITPMAGYTWDDLGVRR